MKINLLSSFVFSLIMFAFGMNCLGQSLENSKLSKSQRIKAIENLQQAFKQRYIGYNLKEKLIGKNPEQIFSDCRDRETKTEDSLHSFNFQDSILVCLAELKDSHLILENSQTTIATFIADAKFINNKLFITQLRSELIRMTDELNRSHLVDKLSVGFEIVSVDGKSPNVAVAEMEKYISSSSAKSRRNVAATRLFYRNFNYPLKKSFKIKVRNANSEVNEINLDWFIDDQVKTSPESTFYLKSIGIEALKLPDSVSLLGYGFDNTRKVFSTFENFQIYLDTKQDEVLRLGVAKADSKKLCYLQALSFQIQPKENGVLFPIHNKNGEKPVSYLSVLKDFLSFCEKEKYDLVLDLKYNPGGDFNLSERFFSMLEIKSQSNIHFGYAQNRMQGLSDWLFEKSAFYDREIFSGKVVSLISGECKSGCDLLALALKLSKRGIILGEPTNGATFGFDLQMASINFKDDSGLVAIKIPNFVFQILNAMNNPRFETAFDFSKLEPIENRPISPDIALPLTINDINSNFVDYRKKILDLIQSK